VAPVAVGAGGEGAGPGDAPASLDGRDLLKRTGGVRPVPRRRWELRLSLDEREEISRGLAAGRSLRAIAAGLGRAPSTVSREVSRNGGRAGYRALAADQAAWMRAVRLKPTKLGRWPGLRAMVEDKLELRWSLRWSPESRSPGGCGGGSRPGQ